jgi:uncharacterized membrane protein
MTTTLDPYAVPKSRVADVPHGAPDGDFLPDGQGVGMGNGWSWISDAWALFEGNRAVALGIFIIFAVLSVLPSLVPIIGPLAVYLLMPVLSGGIMLGCDALRRGEKLEIGHLFAGFSKNTGRLVGVGVFVLVSFVAIFALVFLIFGAGMLGIFTGGMVGEQPNPEQLGAIGLTLAVAVLVVLGLSIPVYMALWFAPSLIVLNDMQLGAALKASFFGCLKNILPFFVWSLVFLVLAILASMPLLLGWLLLGPVIMGSFYTSYRDIYYSH